jgi:protoporphyrinogen/coproporphyrinogen III oxidase
VPRVAIMGAGIGGLAAAYRLRQLAEAQGRALEVVVLEQGDRAGGSLSTESHEGTLLERGPDSLVTHKPAAIALCEELGLGARLVYPPAAQTDILWNGRLVPVPDGFALLAPTRLASVLTSPLLSWRGKLRLLRGPATARGALRSAPTTAGENPVDDESVASFVRRRFGSEVLERLAEPIVGGIYMADVERLSVAASFPRLLAMERAAGGPPPAVWQRAFHRPRSGGAAAPAPKPPVALLTGGLGQIVDALLAHLPAGALRLSTGVESLTRTESGFALQLTSGERLRADAVVIAAPGAGAAKLLRDLDARLAATVSETAYASCVTINLAWPGQAIGSPPQSQGFFVPRTAGLPMVAAGFVHAKFPERVPAGIFVVRVFLGGALHPEIAASSDEDLARIATTILTPLLALSGPSSWCKVFRHPLTMPQRPVGHLEVAAAIRTRLTEHPGLEFAGGPVGAYGLPDAIAAGEAAAARLLNWLGARDSPR